MFEVVFDFKKNLEPFRIGDFKSMDSAYEYVSNTFKQGYIRVPTGKDSGQAVSLYDLNHIYVRKQNV